MTEPPPRNNRDRDRVAAPQRSRSPYHSRKPKEGKHKKERRMKRKREGVTQKQINDQKNPLIPAIWPPKKQKKETPTVWPKEYHRNKEGRLAAKKRRSESSSNSSNNQIEKLTKVKSQSEIDKERNSESWLKEQQLFRECEIKYMHLIQRWEKAIRNENSNQLLCLYKKEFLTSSSSDSEGNDNDGNSSRSKIESFSAPFIEEYKLKKYIKQSKDIIDEFGNDDEDAKSIVKKVQDTFARTYGSKKRHVPKGFEAKKERKEKKEDTTVDEYTGERIIKTVIRTENDIIVVKSRVKPNSDVDQQKICIILDRVLDMGGKPTTTESKSKSYRQQFITATKSNAYMSQQIVAESMLKDVRKCMGGIPVRFLRKIPKTQAFVEEKKDIARSALSNAISLYLSSTTAATVTTDDAAEANAVTTVTTDVANEDADADSSPAVESQSVADADASSSDSDSDTDSSTSDSDPD